MICDSTSSEVVRLTVSMRHLQILEKAVGETQKPYVQPGNGDRPVYASLQQRCDLPSLCFRAKEMNCGASGSWRLP